MEPRTYVDIHILQTVPPANLNRDDAGSPKQAIYGGVRRARVSSQAWKRAARVAFADLVPAESLATRTKKIAKLVSDRLAARTGLAPDAAARIATTLLKSLDIKPGKKAEETAYLLFFGRPQIEELISQVADRADELATLDDEALADAVSGVSAKAILGSGHPIDVALFGRMVAELPELNVDAATQVAHALSTHQAELQFDYYTAVDDENLKGETGAGMIGTIEFNSATLYRFATVELSQLLRNLGGDIEAATTALEVFLNAFTKSMPSGHTNSFAHRTLPGLVSVAVRDDQPINLVSAFESPVRSASGTFDASLTRLAEEARKVRQLWGAPPLQVASTYSIPNGDAALFREVFGEPQPFKELVTAIAGVARDRLTGVSAG
jgi:CRISPR system Cascade subunit CasC